MRVRGAGWSDNFIDRRLSQSADTKRVADAGLNAPREPWCHYLKYSLIAIVLQLVLGWPYAFPDGGRPACDDDAPFQNAKMCGLEQSLRFGHMQLRFLTAVVLGGYVVSTVSLWRLRRTNYCALCGATKNALIQIGTLVPDPEARERMARWVILGYELAILKARGKMDSDEGRKYLKSKGLLDDGDEEWSSMVEGERHTTVWYWIQRKSIYLVDAGVVTTMSQLSLCNAVTLIREKANDLMSCIDRDQPFAYSSAVGVNVSFSVFTMCFWKGVEWAIWFYETDGMVWTEPRMYAEFIILLIYTTVFCILYDIDQVLYNPFGPRELDVPHDLVGGGIQNLASRIGSSTSCFPPSQEPGAVNFSKSEKMSKLTGATNIAKQIEYERDQVYGSYKKRSGSLLGFRSQVNQINSKTNDHHMRSSALDRLRRSLSTVQERSIDEEYDLEEFPNEEGDESKVFPNQVSNQAT